MSQAELPHMPPVSLRGRRSASLTLADRVAYYLSRCTVDEKTGCLLWTGKLRSDGYGVVYIDFKSRLLHQVVYEHFVGPRPPGSNLHHACGRKHCANIAHLVLLGVDEHARQHPSSILAAAAESARRKRAATHCTRGHEFTPENTKLRADGYRECRACSRQMERKRRARA